MWLVLWHFYMFFSLLLLSILGVAIDAPNNKGMSLIRKTGKVSLLKSEIESRKLFLNFWLNCFFNKFVIII